MQRNPPLELAESSTDGTVKYYKSGNIRQVSASTSVIGTHGALSQTLPVDFRPKETSYFTCLITRSSTPAYVIGYVSLTLNGVMAIVEPFNGSFRYPEGANAYFTITYIVE